MGLGTRNKMRPELRLGTRNTIAGDVLTDRPGASGFWSVDASSLKGVPANAAEWTDVLAAAGINNGLPHSLWLCQDTSGFIMDSLATNNMAPTSPVYRTAVTGWTRVGLNTAAGGGRGAMASGTVANTAIESGLLLGYVAQTVTTQADTNKDVFAMNTPNYRAVIATGSFYGTFDLNSGVKTPGAVPFGLSARPVILQVNRTAGTLKVYTDAEVISGPYVAPTTSGRFVFWGYASSGAARHTLLYLCHFKGSAAELSDAQIRSLLQTLGWTVGW